MSQPVLVQPNSVAVPTTLARNEEAALELGVSLSTARRVWRFARAWLLREVKKQTS
jgi:hypothetical protein